MSLAIPTFAAIAARLNDVAPMALAESYDNVGLLIGAPNALVTGVMTSLDVTEAVLDEAIAMGCNLIVSHHPLIFKGLKRLIGANATERTAIKAIKHDIGIIACHTNLDHAVNGVSIQLAKQLGLADIKVLQPLSGRLANLVYYVPAAAVELVLDAAYAAGAGHIGLYDQCSFRVGGTGTYRPLMGSNPTEGTHNNLSSQDEIRVELIYPIHVERKLIEAIKAAHPYEEVAYSCIALNNTWADVGAGAIGKLPAPMPLTDFLTMLKDTLNLQAIKYTDLERPVQTIAVAGGTCSFLIGPAKAAKADVLVTADIKYHEWFDAEGHLSVVDIGHYESEILTMALLADLLTEKFPNIAVRFTTVITNPVKHH